MPAQWGQSCLGGRGLPGRASQSLVGTALGVEQSQSRRGGIVLSEQSQSGVAGPFRGRGWLGRRANPESSRLGRAWPTRCGGAWPFRRGGPTRIRGVGRSILGLCGGVAVPERTNPEPSLIRRAGFVGGAWPCPVIFLRAGPGATSAPFPPACGVRGPRRDPLPSARTRSPRPPPTLPPGRACAQEPIPGPAPRRTAPSSRPCPGAGPASARSRPRRGSAGTRGGLGRRHRPGLGMKPRREKLHIPALTLE